MKSFFKFCSLVAILITGAMGVSFAQTVVTQNFGVTARLASQLSVTKQSDVDFGGIFIPATTSATVTMDKDGGCTVSAGTTTLYAPELRRPGSFYIHADQASAYTLQYPATVELRNTDGNSVLNYTPKMYDNAGTVIPSSGSTSYNLAASSFKTYTFAGDLVIPNTASTGIHTGNFNLTVTWQ